MVTLTIDGVRVTREPGTTVLEAARFLGTSIPTLCHRDGLSPYGACRLCVVQVGEGPTERLVSSCTYPVQEGLAIRTATPRVLRARRMVIELMLASCPESKVVQDLAAEHGVNRQRFRQEHEACLLCGLCVRMCREQMGAGALGFRGRGATRSIGTPFDMESAQCRLCGACMQVCPACQLRCSFNDTKSAVCGACANIGTPGCPDQGDQPCPSREPTLPPPR